MLIIFVLLNAIYGNILANMITNIISNYRYRVVNGVKIFSELDNNVRGIVMKINEENKFLISIEKLTNPKFKFEQKYILSPIDCKIVFIEPQKIYLKCQETQSNYGVMIEYNNKTIKEFTLFFLSYNCEITYLNTVYRETQYEIENKQSLHNEYNIFQNQHKEFKESHLFEKVNTIDFFSNFFDKEIIKNTNYKKNITENTFSNLIDEPDIKRLSIDEEINLRNLIGIDEFERLVNNIYNPIYLE